MRASTKESNQNEAERDRVKLTYSDESLFARLDVLRDIRLAEMQLNKGRSISHSAARKKALKKLRK